MPLTKEQELLLFKFCNFLRRNNLYFEANDVQFIDGKSELRFDWLKTEKNKGDLLFSEFTLPPVIKVLPRYRVVSGKKVNKVIQDE
jgi:hypothetical protein